ncbi:unnamed protein product [Vitrella brassicaformis CCMP3155]|uniref:Fe2OG dioxygenase domain-containing protein n=2 Tax=Vitrella brassicaformis TaxID=1169539 RepID=A0A0G4EG57_VITBC|nr:unnamed protein product [Vitrella brassicaformis CCMP3155]|mmetsp:Transcript_46046/g.114485  ORF Transcript_46046/g.114485 Transcript_46046/m.114485 type:complete len:333 (+) Transcript_46046:105-1103(+)|eukprot:CEL94460.1 unnamed protein product [Vitrella brassicaformis CCMP3155]
MVVAHDQDENAYEGGIGGDGVIAVKKIEKIDMSSFDSCRKEIRQRVWEAASDIGFFQLVNHLVPKDMIAKMFDYSEQFFSLPMEKKQALAYKKEFNAGFEYLAQIRPSTGTPDQKESFTMSGRAMTRDFWPSEDDLPGFKEFVIKFMRTSYKVAKQLFECFAESLGFEPDFFNLLHDLDAEDSQIALRLLHYHDCTGRTFAPGYWRAGAHTDWDSLTLLYQREGQGGLEVCGGKAALEGKVEWSPVEPRLGDITVNIGDMLKRWSDDRLKSTWHRVRLPREGEYMGPRYSIAFFTQANYSAVIQGPGKAYPAITAGEFQLQRINNSYGTRGA